VAGGATVDRGTPVRRVRGDVRGDPEVPAVGDEAERTLTIEAGGDTRTVARTTTQPVRSYKAHRPRKAAL
jgi:hypothetical protein